ncbi:uncharacterized protein SETTUDRAFT_105680, partial [Exserohilum turcica Et28A]
AKSSGLGEVTVKHDDSADEVAMPTPIAQTCWKVISPNGCEQVCYEPIPGFEHLWSSRGPIQRATGFAVQPKAIAVQPYQPVTPLMPGQKSRGSRQTARKRTRSTGRGFRSRHITRALSEEEEDEQLECDVKISVGQSYTFYIGDIDELKKFFRRRLDELTMKPVRPIVTQWIRRLEPRRLSLYGPYHKNLLKSKRGIPPWWPRGVQYVEPAHLSKTELLILAVDVMLQHRLIDIDKRRGSWVAELRKAAQIAIDSIPRGQFSSSKGSDFSEKMQRRALEEILPNLFEVAQLYEDHFARHGHYEGSGIPDPGKGKHVTWQPLMRPIREPVAPKKRLRRTRPAPASKLEPDTDALGDETEVDDSVTSLYLRSKQLASNRIDMSKSAKSTAIRDPTTPSSRGAAAAELHSCSCSTTVTPNDSFGQSMQGLLLEEEADLDIEMTAPTPLHNHTYTNDSQLVQYFYGHPSYNAHAIQLQQDGCALTGTSRPTFSPATAPVYQPSLSGFDTHFALPVDNTMFHEGTSFPQSYDLYDPSSANTLEFLDGIRSHSSVSCKTEATRH